MGDGVMTTATPRAMAAGYDAFLSYNWRDHEAVEQVASSLQKRDLRVFLDRWYLPAGIPWVRILEDSIGSCRAVVVFVGAHGLGNWQQRESNLALTRQAADGTFPVIPVLLPGAEPPLGFLSQNTWLRFPSRPDDDTFLETLAAAILGGELPREVQERLLAALASVCPFRGL